MGFDHIKLINQNLPPVTKSGPITHLDRAFLIVIAGHLPVSSTTYEWYMPMEELKHELGMKPETWDQSVSRIVDKMVDQGWAKTRNGAGRKAITYILTDKLMKGHVAPERESKATTGETGSGHECRCKGKEHTNDAACRQYEYAQRKKGKSTRSRRGKQSAPARPAGKAKAKPAAAADTNAPCKYGPTHQYTEARKPLTKDQIAGGVTSILWCGRDKRCKARMGIHADGRLYGDD